MSALQPKSILALLFCVFIEFVLCGFRDGHVASCSCFCVHVSMVFCCVHDFCAWMSMICVCMTVIICVHDLYVHGDISWCPCFVGCAHDLCVSMYASAVYAHDSFVHVFDWYVSMICV